MPVSSLAGHPLEAAIEEDLIDLLRLSLEAEEDEQKQLAENFEAHQEDVRRLAEEHDLLQREREELLAIKEKLEDDRTYLHEMIEDTCTSLDQSEEERETLATEVSANRKMLEAEKERIRLLQERIAGKNHILEQKAQEIKSLEAARDAIDRDNRKLSTDLKISETEKQILEQNLISAHVEIETIQRQTSELVEGVSIFAQSSTEIKEEIRQSQALSLNAIFSRFSSNRAGVVFEAMCSGGHERSLPVNTVLVSNGVRAFAVFHARATPLWPSGSSGNLQGLNAILRTADGEVSFTEIFVLDSDPRTLTAPIPEETAAGPELDTFDLATDPLRFPEAVLIGNREG